MQAMRPPRKDSPSLPSKKPSFHRQADVSGHLNNCSRRGENTLRRRRSLLIAHSRAMVNSSGGEPIVVSLYNPTRLARRSIQPLPTQLFAELALDRLALSDQRIE